MGNSYDFERLGNELLSRAESLLPNWLPGGRVAGNYYQCDGLEGGKGKALAVNLVTGQWKDFRSDIGGKDMVSLFAQIRGMSQGEAYRDLEGIPDKVIPSKKKRKLREYNLTRPPTKQAPSCKDFRLGEPSRVWTYEDQEGLLFAVARYDYEEDGRKRKEVKPWSWDAKTSKWVPKAWDDRRALYNTQALIDHPKKAVVVVEGEKAADAAQQILGTAAIATTWSGGSSAWKRTDWTVLSGRRQVIIWPDRDKPGTKVASEIAKELYTKVGVVKVLDVGEDKEDGADAADALAKGMTCTRFLTWAKSVAVQYTNGVNRAPIATAVASAHVTVATPSEVTIGTHGQIAYWRHIGIPVNHSGVPTVNENALDNVLEKTDILGFEMWYEEFLAEILIKEDGDVRSLTDEDVIELTKRIQRDLGLQNTKRTVVGDCLKIYGKRRKRNKGKALIEDAPKWDGVKRIEQFFQRTCMADDSEYSRAVGRVFWTSIVARVLKPGCKFDYMFVLEGKQGNAKSSLLKEVLGEEWHWDADGNFGDDDMKLHMRECIVIEVGELDSLSKSTVTQIKRFITNTTDSWRRPYDRNLTKIPRHCIFVGTTNEQTYLRDHTGNRRFLPIKCPAEEIDVAYVTRNRQQLIAEAVDRWNKIGQPGLYKDIPADEAQHQAEMRRRRDDWEALLHKYLMDKSEVSPLELARNGIGIDRDKISEMSTGRIARAMTALGWEMHLIGDSGYKHQVWRRIGAPVQMEIGEELGEF